MTKTNSCVASLLRDRLSLKQLKLGETENVIQRYVNSGSYLNNKHLDRNDNSNFFADRRQTFVKSTVNHNNKSRLSLGTRLGPKVKETESFDDEEDAELKTVHSHIIVDKKSRDEIIAEKKKKSDPRDNIRNRRMFGSLLGTLQQFRVDETKSKSKDEMRKHVELKIEEKSKIEKENARKQKEALFEERRKQRHEIRMIELQMKRTEAYELWEASKRSEQLFIRSKTFPPLYYMPKIHNEQTLTALENSIDIIENEIMKVKRNFEKDLDKIEARISCATEDYEEYAEDECEDSDSFRPSVISCVVKQPVKNDGPAPFDGDRNNQRMKSQTGQMTARRDISPKTSVGKTAAEILKDDLLAALKKREQKQINVVDRAHNSSSSSEVVGRKRPASDTNVQHTKRNKSDCDDDDSE